ncbi:unnamed protein product [Adineta steineri]|uniref:Uncharacterized protein n=1 Tax=Adineta steineri TaxID=433720 RepID=A0A815T1L8_9BILA|nr:unnamed protein product [Adineta steineri]CAF1496133.1 unnamed protein product [Adineta steineri]
MFYQQQPFAYSPYGGYGVQSHTYPYHHPHHASHFMVNQYHGNPYIHNAYGGGYGAHPFHYSSPVHVHHYAI